MMKSFIFDGVAQRASDGLLARHFVKTLRAPFACDYFVGHEEIWEPESRANSGTGIF